MSIVLPNVNAAFCGAEESMESVFYSRETSVETSLGFQRNTGLMSVRHVMSNIGLGAEIVEKYCIH
jgi:hypothetical protein